jgi:hypothetical protein
MGGRGERKGMRAAGPSWPHIMGPRARGAAGGKGAPPGENAGEGAAVREGEGKERGPYTNGKIEKRRNPRCNNGGGHRRRRSSPEPSTNLSIEDEPLVGSTKRRHQDEALDEANTEAPSDSNDDVRIKRRTQRYPQDS